MSTYVKIDETSYFNAYLLSPKQNRDDQVQGKPLMLVFPGGAYRFICDREGEPVAIRANAAGFHAIVLRYTLLPEKPDLTVDDLLQEVTTCLDWAEEHAAEFDIDMSKVSVCGFSAGGHLAAWSSIKLSDRISRAILAYGAIGFTSEQMDAIYQYETSPNQISKYSEEELKIGKEMIRMFVDAPIQALHANVPPTFLFATNDDRTVPSSQSLLYALRLHELNIPCEAHFYAMGGHGLSLADDVAAGKPEQNIPRVATWFDLAISWLKNY